MSLPITLYPPFVSVIQAASPNSLQGSPKMVFGTVDAICNPSYVVAVGDSVMFPLEGATPVTTSTADKYWIVDENTIRFKEDTPP